MTFQELNLIPPLTRAVAQQGYLAPTPIQRKAIPLLLQGRDLIGCAQTGTGKTAAFALPILQNLAPVRGGHIKALVLTPTRELAIQIYDSFVSYGANLRLRCAVIFGGVGQNPQVQALQRGVDILVATPGRLCDLMGQGYIDLSRLSVFVLDEADRMLDMGFIHDVKRVVRALPTERQTLLFSATMPAEIEALAQTLLHDPATVKVDPVTTPVEAIDQCVYLIDKGNKRHLLARLLRGRDVGSALVFTRTKHGADKVVKELAAAGIVALAIHGNKSQNARQNALSSFKSGQVQVLIATDIAARGIDIPELSHVFNYDLPNEPETYIHRIGRTGRAGLGGVAISFCNYDELEYLRDIERLIGRKIPRRESEWPMVILEKTEKKVTPRPPRDRSAAPRAARPAARPAGRPAAVAPRPVAAPRPASSAGQSARRRRGGRGPQGA